MHLCPRADAEGGRVPAEGQSLQREGKEGGGFLVARGKDPWSDEPRNCTGVPWIVMWKSPVNPMLKHSARVQDHCTSYIFQYKLYNMQIIVQVDIMLVL